MTLGAIVPTSGGELLDIAYNPKLVIQHATEAAAVLKSVVERKPKPVTINGEQYLEFEDWQTIGRFYGLSVRTLDSIPVEIAGVHGAKARAEVINRDGIVVGGAEAYCLRDEERWGSRPAYEWKEDGSRVKVGDEPVPWFQLASMAQTRAASKSLSNVLRWVVVLAGYKGTPAEEMTGRERSGQVETGPGTPHWCEEHKANWFKRGKMTSFGHPIDGQAGKWCHEPTQKNESPNAPGGPPAGPGVVEAAARPTVTTSGQGTATDAAPGADPAADQPATASDIAELGTALMNVKKWTSATARAFMEQKTGKADCWTKSDLARVREAAGLSEK